MPDPLKLHDARLGRVILWAALAAFALHVLGTVLALPGGQGPEPFLGLGAAGMTEAAELDAVREAWSRLVLVAVGPLKASLSAVALAYFALDTAVFMPLYGLLFFAVGGRLAHEDASSGTKRIARWLVLLTPWLLAVDLVENTSGLARLAGGGWALALAGALAASAAALAWSLWRGPLGGGEIVQALAGQQPRWQALPRRLPRLLIGGAAAAAALLLAQAFAPGAALRAGAAVHGAKQALTGAIALLFVALALVWLFRRDGTQSGRAALRLGLADILWRTRYVLVALAALVGFTLVLDQCRDVAIGMADGLFAWPQALWAWPTAALSVIAVWALSFSCWLWTRLICRMPAPGSTAAHGLPEDVESTLRSAARGAARLLGVAPAFVAAQMSALASRDAVWAAARGDASWILSPLLLLGMGLACLVGALVFLWDRERVSSAGASGPEDYYNDPTLAPGSDWLKQVAGEKYRFITARGPGAFSMPLIALALAVGLRCLAVAFEPGVPLAFAVIVFALVGWLGVFGWLSVKEQRDSRPWLLLLIAFIGALGFAGLTDNHSVRVITGAEAAALPGVGWQIAGTLGLAALVLAAGWAVARGDASWSWPRVMGGVGLAAALLLVAFDRVSHRDTPPQQAAAPRPDVDEAIERWLEGLWNDSRSAGREAPSPRVFLVASEGGGVRAAYWTARSLQLLREQVPDFDRRTLMLSGVSGVAVALKKKRACEGAGACIDRFGHTDLLTPLLGAWLFEDLLARVLPTSLPAQRWLEGLCRQPGCGFLSRGMWFEQALERAVPGLAVGIGGLGRSGSPGSAGPGTGRIAAPGATPPHAPHLFLNATWVESGDRAIASSVVADWQQDRFSNVRDQLELAGRGRPQPADIPLSAAAHNAARFPFVNAIGRLRSGDGQQGHLADGGYFDNGGAHTTIDVLARLQRRVATRAACAGDDEPCRRRSDWLRSLRPTVIVIQNGVTEPCTQEEAKARLACLRRSWGLGVGAGADLGAAAAPPSFDPTAPVQAGRLTLFADLLGPLVTVVNVAGTGANGRRAEALLQRECQAFGAPDCLVQLAQRSDGLLYPLGWYLSPTARRALDEQARARVKELAARFGP